MPMSRVFQQSIEIQASATTVERCLTDLELMHQWLNPALRCYPVGKWDTRLGSQCRFVVRVPLIEPTLRVKVVEREPGLIVWGFKGFFSGRDRWECQPIASGTRLLNRFEFTIPNPVVRFGFNTFAAGLTQHDMKVQLQRLKQVAQREYRAQM